MSWISRIKNNFIGALAGRPAQPIVNNPTTPVEKAINLAASIVIPVAAALPGANTAALAVEDVSAAVNTVSTGAHAAAHSPDPFSGIAAVVGQSAHAAVDAFLRDHVGNTTAAFTEDALQALATIALSRLQAAQGVSPNAIGSALSDVLRGFSAPVVETRPALQAPVVAHDAA